MTAHLYRVILPVADIERAAECYGILFEERGERVSPGRHYFDCGGTILACYDPVADGDEASADWLAHENQYLYFSVADLEAARERALEAGCRDVGDVASMPWGERLFYARDPFGHPICFVDEDTVFRGSG